MSAAGYEKNLSLQNVEHNQQPLINGGGEAGAPSSSNNVNNDNATETQKNYKCRTCLWFTVGFFLMIFVIQFTFVPHLIDHAIKQNIIDAFIFTHPEPDNSHYQSWQTNSGSNSVPIRFAIQFFNVTNPDEVLINGSMPKLKLTEPIVYDQYYYRKQVNFSDDGEYVKHVFFTEYLFNSELSKLSPHEKLTVFSPLLGTLWHQWDVAGIIEREAMKKIVEEFEKRPEMLFWSNTAGDLIWSIYNITINEPITHKNLFNFTWGFMRNQSNQYYITHTGHNDIKRMGEVQRWCRDPLTIECLEDPNNEYITAWSPWMSINPGHLFYVGVYALTDLDDKNDVKPLWVDILFRNIYLTYNGSYDFKGITLDKYGIQMDPMLLNTTQYPPNQQFNQFGPSGILNSSSAYGGIAIYLSMVLFYGAPDYMANNSKMNIPNPGPFDYPYIDIEPKTGAVFYANASMQICSPIHSLPNLNNKTVKQGQPNLYNLPDDMMVPIYLVTFSDELTDELANNFKSSIGLGDTINKTSVIIGYVSIPLLIIWSLVSCFALGVYCHNRGIVSNDNIN